MDISTFLGLTGMYTRSSDERISSTVRPGQTQLQHCLSHEEAQRILTQINQNGFVPVKFMYTHRNNIGWLTLFDQHQQIRRFNF